MQDHEEILSKLGDRLGLDLAFDDNRQCFLILDQKLMVSIRQKPSTWLFYGMIEDDVEWKEKSFWKNLLEINLDLAENGGGSISFEPESGALMYVHSLEAQNLDAESAYMFFENFVDILEAIGNNPLLQEQ